MEPGLEGRRAKGSSSWVTTAGAVYFLTIISIFSQNLVQNGNFSADGGSFAGWQISHPYADTNYPGYSPTIYTWGSGAPPGDPYYARFEFEEGGGLDDLSQIISTIPGDVYDISFYAEDGDGHNGETDFSFGNVTEDLEPAFSIGPGEWYYGWTNFTFSLTATALDTELAFLVSADTGSEFGVTGISVTPVPRLEEVLCRGAFQLMVTNCTSPVIIQASTNMIDWVTVCTNTAPCIFTDSCAKAPRCFYRAAVLVQ